MDERLKELRGVLNMTQQEFADALKIKRNTIAKYETGRGEPIDAVVALICQRFDVREEWLRKGEGAMFATKNRDEEVAAFIKNALQKENAGFQRSLIAVMSRMSVQEWEIIERKARELLEELQKETAGQ